jgi:hypothetical protein
MNISQKTIPRFASIVIHSQIFLIQVLKNFSISWNADRFHRAIQETWFLDSRTSRPSRLILEYDWFEFLAAFQTTTAKDDPFVPNVNSIEIDKMTNQPLIGIVNQGILTPEETRIHQWNQHFEKSKLIWMAGSSYECTRTQKSGQFTNGRLFWARWYVCKGLTKSSFQLRVQQPYWSK